MLTADTPQAPPIAPTKRRGGARKGSGIKAADGTVTQRHQLRLDAATVEVFARLGGGNVSLGAREAARLAAAAEAGAFTTPHPAGSGDGRSTPPGGG